MTKVTRKELQELAKSKNVNIYKPGKRKKKDGTSILIYKSKKELVNELQDECIVCYEQIPLSNKAKLKCSCKITLCINCKKKCDSCPTCRMPYRKKKFIPNTELTRNEFFTLSPEFISLFLTSLPSNINSYYNPFLIED